MGIIKHFQDDTPCMIQESNAYYRGYDDKKDEFIADLKEILNSSNKFKKATKELIISEAIKFRKKQSI